MQCLRTLVEPKVRAAKEGHVPLSSLGSEERQALASFLMADCLTWLGSLLNPRLPDYIVAFDRLHLAGGRYEPDGKQGLLLISTLPTPDGRNLRHTGLMIGVPQKR